MRKLLSFFVIVILLITILNLAKGSLESHNKLKEVNSNQGDLKSLQIKNQELKQQVSLEQSDFSLEKEARDKLGYGKPGETAIVLRDANLDLKVASTIQKEKSNFSKWLEFFKINL